MIIRGGMPAVRILPEKTGIRNQGTEERLHTGFRPSSGCRFVFFKHQVVG
jgi:hypothetical protein